MEKVNKTLDNLQAKAWVYVEINNHKTLKTYWIPTLIIGKKSLLNYF